MRKQGVSLLVSVKNQSVLLGVNCPKTTKKEGTNKPIIGLNSTFKTA
ncbi:MAG: hypothetical protein IJ978_06025 [Clostridia bacterium]|nr:hypothetical protein [Clostridia bacterium]